jgi:hypothetical protein
METRADLAGAFVVLGLGAWVTVNGVYQELPYIALTAPEGYDIFSYVVVVMGFANCFPAIYIWARSRADKEKKSNGFSDLALIRIPDELSLNSDATESEAYWEIIDRRSVLIAVGCVGIADCVALAIFWDVVAVVGGARRSAGLLFFVFIGGGVDCLTSLLFYPFAGKFPPIFTSYLMSGEALTGLLASLLATLQATSSDPNDPLRFSISLYFYFMGLIMLLAALAFMYLDRELVKCRRVHTAFDATRNEFESDRKWSQSVPLGKRSPYHSLLLSHSHTCVFVVFQLKRISEGRCQELRKGKKSILSHVTLKIFAYPPAIHLQDRYRQSPI